MTTYTVRVELHQASGDDYENLHALMQGAGYSRTVIGIDRKIYRLPTAEYIISTNLSADSIQDNARQLAERTGRACWVLVSGGPLSWYLAIQ